jgi:hypothetical protein
MKYNRFEPGNCACGPGFPGDGYMLPGSGTGATFRNCLQSPPYPYCKNNVIPDELLITPSLAMRPGPNPCIQSQCLKNTNSTFVAPFVCFSPGCACVYDWAFESNLPVLGDGTVCTFTSGFVLMRRGSVVIDHDGVNYYLRGSLMVRWDLGGGFGFAQFTAGYAGGHQAEPFFCANLNATLTETNRAFQLGFFGALACADPLNPIADGSTLQVAS